MSIDKSLKRKGGMTRQRCVLTRAERIAKMMENGKWADGQSPFGLPKTRVQKIALKRKEKERRQPHAPTRPGAPPPSSRSRRCREACCRRRCSEEVRSHHKDTKI